MSFNTPVVPSDGGVVTQCGRVLYSDFHVENAKTSPSDTFPNECSASTVSCSNKPAGGCAAGTREATKTTGCTCSTSTCCRKDSLTPQEKVLEFFLFDLASCIAPDNGTQTITCAKQSCTAMGVQCGLSGDGCGGTQQCPPCPNGQTCGGGGVQNQCGGPACTKQTCGNLDCGKIGDGCGGSLDCGSCQTGKTCGANSPNVCGTGTCTATTCKAQGAECGPLGDGCGNLLDCGPCPSAEVCVGNKCVSSGCTKLTCQQAGAGCGQVSDGCGGLIDCGTCTQPQTCGGGGTPNQCGGGTH
jgi:hypothetical protein